MSLQTCLERLSVAPLSLTHVFHTARSAAEKPPLFYWHSTQKTCDKHCASCKLRAALWVSHSNIWPDNTAPAHKGWHWQESFATLGIRIVLIRTGKHLPCWRTKYWKFLHDDVVVVSPPNTLWWMWDAELMPWFNLLRSVPSSHLHLLSTIKTATHRHIHS